MLKASRRKVESGFHLPDSQSSDQLSGCTSPPVSHCCSWLSTSVVPCIVSSHAIDWTVSLERNVVETDLNTGNKTLYRNCDAMCRKNNF
ncbi:hypothetical protein CDAR_415571 [Caerostris darwini]|uniref:Uncharacterized protein n=1 Tax=Caerostris darwini TaxID=1538125 RepID=A0AAV4Q286_9ARAC|nr:hypothetical protein CDAR_415571 [Caerostris darwini]